MEATDLAEIYMEIAEKVGVKNTVILFDVLKGRQVSFPQSLYSKEYIYNYIQQNYNGTNIRELSRKFGYTERRVRQIVNLKNIC